MNSLGPEERERFSEGKSPSLLGFWGGLGALGDPGDRAGGPAPLTPPHTRQLSLAGSHLGNLGTPPLPPHPPPRRPAWF